MMTKRKTSRRLLVVAETYEDGRPPRLATAGEVREERRRAEQRLGPSPGERAKHLKEQFNDTEKVALKSLRFEIAGHRRHALPIPPELLDIVDARLASEQKKTSAANADKQEAAKKRSEAVTRKAREIRAKRPGLSKTALAKLIDPKRVRSTRRHIKI